MHFPELMLMVEEPPNATKAAGALWAGRPARPWLFRHEQPSPPTTLPEQTPYEQGMGIASRHIRPASLLTSAST